MPAAGECPLKPTLFHVDIGPTGDWGAPINAESRHLWPAYHETVWEHEGSQDVDLFFIDGRFRVACFMQALLHCRGDSLIMIHDFASRVHYQIIREVAREIAVEENFSVFVPISGQSQRFLSGILTKYRYDGR